MKIAVTGANGFVGAALCDALLAHQYSVRQLVRLPTKNITTTNTALINTEAINIMPIGNIDAQTDWTPALQNIDCVIHCAARVHVMGDTASDSLAEFRRTNVDGTRHLAEQAASLGVKRLVFLSSLKVNGQRTSAQAPFTENDPPNPQDAYAISKYEAEQALWTIARQTSMEVVIIRPPLIYGPQAKGNLAKLIAWVKKGLPLPFGAVDNRRSLLALDNLISFMLLCADREKSPKAANELFLIADGEDVSTTLLLQKMAHAFAAPARLWKFPVCLMSLAARCLGKTGAADRLLGSLQLDSTKARQLLGWKPVLSMDEQLKKMARAAKNNL